MDDDPAETLNLALLEALRDRVSTAGAAPGEDFDAWVLELLQGYRLLRGTGRITPGEQRLILEVMRVLETRHGAPRDQVPAQPQRYIASYPRSGNTMTLGMLKALTPVLTTSDMRDSKLCTMPALERPGFPALRLSKTHQVPAWRPENRYLFVFRDPRDLLPSLAYMTLKAGEHGFTERHQMVDFIAFLHERYVFGSWLEFARAALALQAHENVAIQQYDALDSDWRALARAAAFFGLDVTETRLRAAFSARGQTLEKMRSKPRWGLDGAAPPGSLYEAWMAARGGSNWRETLDAAAKEALKARGYTPALIALGYAEDEDW